MRTSLLVVCSVIGELSWSAHNSPKVRASTTSALGPPPRENASSQSDRSNTLRPSFAVFQSSVNALWQPHARPTREYECARLDAVAARDVGDMYTSDLSALSLAVPCSVRNRTQCEHDYRVSQLRKDHHHRVASATLAASPSRAAERLRARSPD